MQNDFTLISLKSLYFHFDWPPQKLTE